MKGLGMRRLVTREGLCSVMYSKCAVYSVLCTVCCVRVQDKCTVCAMYSVQDKCSVCYKISALCVLCTVYKISALCLCLLVWECVSSNACKWVLHNQN